MTAAAQPHRSTVVESLEAVPPIEVTICKHMMLLLQPHDIVDVAAVLIVAVGLFAVVTAAFAVTTIATTYYFPKSGYA